MLQGKRPIDQGKESASKDETCPSISGCIREHDAHSGSMDEKGSALSPNVDTPG
jgi:hypothetical protein